MALIFGSGEPISRLRRSLDIKGKVNLGVDEIIVPTLLLFDSTLPPFRRTGVRWFIEVIGQAVAGEFGRVRLFHTLNIDQLVDQITFQGTGAGALRFIVGAGPSGNAAGNTTARTTEIVNADNGGVISRQVPIQGFGDSVTPTSLSQIFHGVNCRTSETITLQTEIVLPAMPDIADPITNAPTLTIEGSAANVAFRIILSGLYWDSLPLNVRT